MAQATLRHQERILANEKVIIVNQKMIMRRQGRMMVSHRAIIQNQKKILAALAKLSRRSR